MRLLIIFVSFILTPHLVYANTLTIMCPKTIESNDRLLNTPRGWTGWQPRITHTWQAVTFYDGHPKEEASLAPDQSNHEKASWRFRDTSDRNLYISCGYYRSSLELIQPLPKKVKSCIVFYNRKSYGEQGQIPDKIRCIN